MALPQQPSHSLRVARTDSPLRLTDAAASSCCAPTPSPFRPAEEIERDEWRSGRVLLIGDAAHACSPTLAQGGSLAIEDAIVLADLLASEISVNDAIDAFVARRQPRAQWVRERTHHQIELLNAGAPHEHLARGMRETYARLAETSEIIPTRGPM